MEIVDGHAVGVADQFRALRAAPRKARRALVSAWAGFYVDMVDIYLPVVALAPALAYFQPASLTPAQASAFFFATFAATLLGRPLGALLFGHLADTLGRRRVTLMSIAGFSTCTLLIGLLPGYASWGLAAPALLVTLRFVDGVFLGGEYTAATPLAFEYCPKHARGLFGGLLQGAYAVAYLTISVLVLVLLQFLPADGMGSEYVEWGWRVPFIIGAALGYLFLLYRARVPESELWQASVKVRRPLRRLLAAPTRGQLLQVWTLMTGLWFVSTSVVSVMPRLLQTQAGMSSSAVTATLLVSHLGVLAGFIAAGLLGQRIGRRRLLIGGVTLAGTLGLGLYAWLASLTTPGMQVVVLTVLTQLVVLSVWGVVTPYCTERFATAVRSSGFGVAYSVSVVIPGFYAAYMAGLDAVMPYQYTQLVLLGLGAALAAAAAWRGPETSHVDLAGTASLSPAPAGARS